MKDKELLQIASDSIETVRQRTITELEKTDDDKEIYILVDRKLELLDMKIRLDSIIKTL